jgi:hypothetical protein
MPSIPSPVLPPSWTEVLEAMQRSLAEVLAAVPDPPPASAGSDVPPWQADLERLDRRLAELDASSRRAEENATSLEAELAGGADAFRRWLAAAAASRQALADASARTV